jgi:hypothetical protein
MNKAMMTAVLVVMSSMSARASTVFSTDFSSATQAGGIGTAVIMGGTTNGVTVGALTGGSGVINLQIDSISSAGQVVPPVFASASVGANLSSNLVQAISNNEYFQFTISSLTALNYLRFSFDMVKHGFGSFAGITLRSSADNYVSDLMTVIESMAQGVYSGEVDLSVMAAFSNLTSITFRFYLYDGYSGTNNRRLGIDNIEIQAVSAGGRLGLVIIH